MALPLLLPPLPEDYEGPCVISSTAGVHRKVIEDAGHAHFQLQCHLAGETSFLDEGETTPASEVDDDVAERAKRKRRVVPRGADGQENLYALLGLEDVNCDATDEEIRRAYRRMALVHHPDKQGDDSSSHTMFLAIQRAYDTLSDPAKRRGYDSQFEFDESIPDGTEELSSPEEFFSCYGPVFRRNARFSVKKPVPLLGDMDTPWEDVEQFYAFWYRFESWRDFSALDEYNPDDADSRMERRWMEAQNNKARGKLKRAEMQRVLTLVQRAHARDPRVKAHEEAERERRRQQKEAKKEQKRARERRIQEQREAEERKKREKEEAVQAEKDKEKKERKAEKERLRASRRGVRTVANPVVDSEETSLQRSDVDHICLSLSRDGLESLREKLESSTDIREQEAFLQEELDKLVDDERLARERAERVRREREEAQRRAKAEKLRNKSPPWTPEEVSLLTRAIAKYPGGTRNRWDVIANFVNAADLGTVRTKEDCIAKANSIGEGDVMGDEGAFARSRRLAAEKEARKRGKRAAPAEEAPGGSAGVDDGADVAAAAQSAAAEARAAQSGVAAVEKGLSAAEAASEVAAKIWTQEQQVALEEALKKFPASMDKKERWTSIAKEVPGKSMKQCVARFKELRQKMKKGSS